MTRLIIRPSFDSHYPLMDFTIITTLNLNASHLPSRDFMGIFIHR